MSWKWLNLILLVGWFGASRVRAQGDSNAPATGGNDSNSLSPPALADFSVQVNDGLGKPVPGVAVEVFRFMRETNGTETKILLGVATSGTDGLAKGQYAKSSIPTNQTFLVSLMKSGYSPVTAAPQETYVMARIYRSNDVAQIAKLPYASLNEQLPELLAGEMDSRWTMADVIFAHENDLHRALKRLVDDANVGRQAAEMLAYIGYPDDVRLLLGDAFLPTGNPAVNRWADAVASALLAPTTEREWSFLKSCAADDFGDQWVDEAGIRTLRLIASPKSLQILRDVRAINTNRVTEVDAGIAYINTHPAALTDASLSGAAEKTARGVSEGFWLGNEEPRYNEQRDKALVDINYVFGGTHYLVYTATFHHDAGLWKLRGVRETKDTLLPDPPGVKKAQAANNSVKGAATNSPAAARN
jgi:hypothetical protein